MGGSGIAAGCHRRVVIAPEEPGFLVEPEALNAAVHRQVWSEVGLKEPVAKLGPVDISSHQLVGERVVAPERVTQEVDEIQLVPFGADTGILEMFSGIGALVEDGAA